MSASVETLCQESIHGNLQNIQRILGLDKSLVNAVNSQSNLFIPFSDSIDYLGQTALFCASSAGHTQIVLHLLKNGADVQIPCEADRISALHGSNNRVNFRI